MESDRHYATDEKSFSDLFVRHKSLPSVVRNWLIKLYKIPAKVSFEEAYSTPNTRPLWHDGARQYPNEWYYKDGRLTNNQDGSREFPYLHFLYWKNDIWLPKDKKPVLEVDVNNTSGWTIGEYGFTKK